MTYTCPYCNIIYETAPKLCSCTPYPEPSDSFMLRSENAWVYKHLTKEQYQMFLNTLAAKRGKPVSELIRSEMGYGEDEDERKGYMLIQIIDDSTPGEINIINMITDISKEEYEEFLIHTP